MASHLDFSLADGRMHTANHMPLHCSKLTACSVATRHIQMYAPAHMEEAAENHPTRHGSRKLHWASHIRLREAHPYGCVEALPPTSKALLQHPPQLPAAGTTLAAVTTLIAVMHRHFLVLRLEATCTQRCPWALETAAKRKGSEQPLLSSSMEPAQHHRAQMGWHPSSKTLLRRAGTKGL